MGALDLHLDFASAQHGQAKLKEYAKSSLLSDGNYNTDKINGSNPDDYEKFEKGIMHYGYVFHFSFGCLMHLASA
jgi:RING finger and CHY zinc finger domain-containing protein 1